MINHQTTTPQTNNLTSQDTIIAQCTPQGAGALALLRLCGPQALSIATRMSRLAHATPLDQVPTHTIHYGSVRDTHNNSIDHCLFLVMHAPQTFTGEDTVEITCHNNYWIIDAIIQEALHHGARIANPGEFTQRAFLNNKIDLIQAEAINELIHANTYAALKHSQAQLKGSLSSWIKHLEEELIHALALTEASFEFLDDEQITFHQQIKDIIQKALTTIAHVRTSFDQQQLLRQGVRIALIGSVNAGKSSLFNALLNRNRAIVSNIAGTTRDTLEASMTHATSTWTLVDTAGLRQTDSVIEKEGIERSWQEAHSADVILLVVDQGRSMSASEQELYQALLDKYQHKCIVTFNKSDLPSQIQDSFLLAYHPIIISTTTRDQIPLLEQRIEALIQQLFLQAESPFLLNQRHCNVLINLEQALHKTLNLLEEPIDYSLVAYELKDATAQLAQLTGKTISEDAMDAIFKEFCVGK